MKLIILRNNILEGLLSVEKAVSNNPTLPILKNILLIVKNNKIIITATNLELAIKYYLNGKIIEEGEISIPFSIFNNIIKNLFTDRIQLETNKNNLILISDNYKALINTQSAHEFPIIPTVKNTEEFLSFKKAIFKDIVSKIIIAAQYSEIRPEISGLFIKYTDKTLKLVATDSFRLTEKTLEENDYKTNFKNLELIIPLKSIQEVLKIINDEGDISLFIDSNQVLFKTDKQEIISRIINSQFPDYQTIIPKSYQTEIIVNRVELMNAIKLISAFTGRANDISLKTGENNKFLEVYAGDNQLGENRCLVPVKIKGDNFLMVFNWRYLFDGLKIFDSEEVVLGTNAPDKPMTIKAFNNHNLFYIVMPIKI